MDADTIDKLILSSNLLTEQLAKLKDDQERDNCVQDYLKNVKIKRICDFPEGAEWFNVSEYLSIEDLEGKIVVLDFFTYCCINCMHILPDLKALEEKFSIKDGLVVVGVHSAKFENEKQSQNILAAVQRYNISHPVVNDANAEFWNNLNICCWPTLLILGPDANPLFLLMGEGHRDEIFLFVKNALNYYKNQNNIKHDPLPILSASNLLVKSRGPLLFPGKVTCLQNSTNEILAISDTGNHRIIISADNGQVSYVIGGNGPGWKDGDFATALLNAPQGLVFQDENILFVADTENHAVRKINLKDRIVQTIAGTGVQGIDRCGGKLGINQEISSPWDLCIFTTPDLDMSFHGPNDDVILKKVLLIAMAGTHQIWALFLDDIIWWKFKIYSAGTCLAIAGSGKEENRNNLYPHAAAFAQPSGISLDIENKDLYIADSESSSIRRMSLLDGKVTPVVGGNRSPTNLFDFGDIDGQQYNGKLQHPLGVAMGSSGTLYVADSYNHKIKRVNLMTNTISSIHGTGKPGNSHAKSIIQFNEPGGLCVSNNMKTLYVADTNNHCIKAIDLTKKQTYTEINFILPDNSNASKLLLNDFIEVSENGAECLLRVHFELKSNIKIATQAPNKLSIKQPYKDYVIDSPKFSNPMDIKLIIPEQKNGSNDEIIIKINIVICKENNTCMPLNATLSLNVVYVTKGATNITKHLNFLLSNQGILLK